MSLDIIDDGSIDADEGLQTAAIALVREQWKLVPLCNKNDNLQIRIANDAKKSSTQHEYLQAKVIERCIGFINNSAQYVCSAAVALIHEKWNQLSDNQQTETLGKCILLMDHSSDEISAALSLLRDHLPKEDDRRRDIADKAGNILKSSNDRNVLTAAALFLTDHIQNSKVNEDIKFTKLNMFASFFAKDNRDAGVAAIFMNALQPQAGVGYSQTKIAPQPSASNGYRHAQAESRPAPYRATHPAALARPDR
ncbi:MAG: hypothetical protein FJX22_02565 [Alphaproteobacteria bacterium]|nr:hypothetical protein [Alphaproteobacteria bacterium]